LILLNLHREDIIKLQEIIIINFTKKHPKNYLDQLSVAYFFKKMFILSALNIYLNGMVTH